MKAGNSLHDALFKLYQIVWKYERKPDVWRDSTLIQLNKVKGKELELSNKRYIHTKSEEQKFFSHIVTNVAKPIIVKNMTPFQIGAVPGHCAQEHLYTIKSIISLAEERKEAIALQLFDLSKFFDRECLVDGLEELYKANVKGIIYRLLH